MIRWSDILANWGYVEADFRAHYGVDPLDTQRREFVMLLRGLPPEARLYSKLTEDHEQDDPLWWRKQLDEKLTGGTTRFTQGNVQELIHGSRGT